MPTTKESARRPAKGPRIALAQIAPSLGDTAANLERHRTAVERAVADGANIVVFPELSLAGYRLKDSVPDVAITRESETWKELEQLSAGILLVVGLVEETPDHQFFNAAVCFENGSTVAVHRKTYLPTYGMFDEQRYFARGRSIAAFDTTHGRVAMLVCEDMLHPTAATIAACDGATLLIVPSASPARGVTGEGDADANARTWEAYLQVMARSFGLWIAYCNRVGVEDGVTFWGGSVVVSPAGDELAKAAYYDEDSTSVVLSEDAVRRRRIANPLVRDEDLDLTINELSRIRGRKVESDPRAAKPAIEKPAREGFDKRPRFTDGERPPRRFDRDDDRPRRPRDDDDRPRRAFGDDDRGGRSEGGFGPPRRFDRDDAGPRFSKPRFGAGTGPRNDREGEDRPRFSKPRFGGPPRGKFGPPGDGPRGRFGAPGDGPPRGRFGAPGDGPPRGRFGAPGDGPRGRDDAPRAREGGFKPRGNFGAPRGSFGAPRGRDDRGGEGGGFGAKGRFGTGAPRERQRPDPKRKPFHKGAKPGRGRRDD